MRPIDPELARRLDSLPDLRLDGTDLDRGIDRARRSLADYVAVLPPLRLEDVELRVATVPGPGGGADIPVRVFAPTDRTGTPSPDRPVIIDLHGGGFVMGSADMDDRRSAALARWLGAVIISVDYRLAPEAPYPAAVDDCLTVLRWLDGAVEQWGGDPRRVCLLGDSAGAGLAATMALRLRDGEGPRLHAMALLEPALHDTTAQSSEPDLDGPLWTRGYAAISWAAYLLTVRPDGHSVPGRALDVAGLPPTYLTVNEVDVLRTEGLDFADRLLEASVSTEVHVWAGAFHGFAMAGRSQLATLALASLRSWWMRVLELDDGVPDPRRR